MSDVLTKQKKAKEAKEGTDTGASAEVGGLTSGQIESIVAGSIGGLVVLYLFYRGFRYMMNRRSS